MTTASKGSWSIATYLRIRPLPQEAATEIEYDIQNVTLEDKSKRSVLELSIPFDADPGLVHNNSATGTLRYEFDAVFGPNTTQEAVFGTIAKAKVLDVLNGVNCTVFAYGQTGSGKTYSIFGGDTYAERGLIPRTISLLFSALRSSSLTSSVKLSFAEVYKESITDLLDADRHPVSLFESPNGITLHGLGVYPISTPEEGMRLYFLGSAARSGGSTTMNATSSRSHAVFTLDVETEGVRGGGACAGAADEQLTIPTTIFTSGKVHLVDLAGSERMYKLSNTAANIQQAKAINLSLHYLEQVILSLRTPTTPSSPTSPSSPVFIPYRNSVLTSMLRDSLGGNCRSSFLLTVSSERRHFEESVATCRFGQRCGEIKVTVQANAEIGLSDQLRDMSLKLKALEKALATSAASLEDTLQQLSNERSARVQQTSLRALTAVEKANCTNCVTDLLNAARQFVDSSSGTAGSSEDLIESSQDRLYRTVEQMDKAVLVELSTALGGLVQSIFIEHQLAKAAANSKDRVREELAEKESSRIREEEHLYVLLGNVVDLHTLPRLPAKVVTGITHGAAFIKKDRMGRESVRWLQVSTDLLQLSWEPLGRGTSKEHAAPLSTFSALELLGGDEVSFVLRTSSGARPLHLTYCHPTGSVETVSGFDWVHALQWLIVQNTKTAGVD